MPLIIWPNLHAITSVLERDTGADYIDIYGDTCGDTRRREPGKRGGSQWRDSQRVDGTVECVIRGCMVLQERTVRE